MGWFCILHGLAYFFLYDLIIHQRFKVFTKKKNVFVLALRRDIKCITKNRERRGESLEC
jgi:beta-carotene 3-hydroxylase